MSSSCTEDLTLEWGPLEWLGVQSDRLLPHIMDPVLLCPTGMQVVPSALSGDPTGHIVCEPGHLPKVLRDQHPGLINGETETQRKQSLP